MSQQIRVLQCIQCKMYQVDLVKKGNKWECKICRQKQDLLEEFFRGSGPECRAKVQQMNLERGQQEERMKENLFLSAQQQLDQQNGSVEKQENRPLKKTKNKWADYVDEPIEVTQSSAVRPTKVTAVREKLSDGISMNFNRSKGLASKATKRPAHNEATSLSSKTSKWSNYL
ncbi:MRN complex-interacting protein [Drosophila serrata]|uniref:MRN complex-interacting protein n=1 Tax=Drosophila serrata TaxID=7274 RepID=UPI000A1D3269|nr:MRN complex-interacting protein [Drosophila serrata]